MYSPVFLSWPTTSGSPPVLSISCRDNSFSVFASSFACTSAHSRPLWRCMFFSKRAFKAFSNSLCCSDDNSFFLLLAGWGIVLRSTSIREFQNASLRADRASGAMHLGCALGRSEVLSVTVLIHGNNCSLRRSEIPREYRHDQKQQRGK